MREQLCEDGETIVTGGSPGGGKTRDTLEGLTPTGLLTDTRMSCGCRLVKVSETEWQAKHLSTCRLTARTHSILRRRK